MTTLSREALREKARKNMEDAREKQDSPEWKDNLTSQIKEELQEEKTVPKTETEEERNVPKTEATVKTNLVFSTKSNSARKARTFYIKTLNYEKLANIAKSNNLSVSEALDEILDQVL